MNTQSPYHYNINACSWLYSNGEQCHKQATQKIGNTWYCEKHARLLVYAKVGEIQRHDDTV